MLNRFLVIFSTLALTVTLNLVLNQILTLTLTLRNPKVARVSDARPHVPRFNDIQPTRFNGQAQLQSYVKQKVVLF